MTAPVGTATILVTTSVEIEAAVGDTWKLSSAVVVYVVTANAPLETVTVANTETVFLLMLYSVCV